MMEEAILEYKEIRTEIERKKKILSDLRQVIINEMIDTDTKTLYTASGSASLSHPKSLDQGSLRTENKKEYFEFTTTRIVTEHIEDFDKKKFKKKYPQIYEKYEIELTPRLTVK